MDLGLVGHQLGERAAEPDRLGRQVDAPAVALVEDQVDDREHRREPVRQQVVGRHPERDAGGLDLLLRPHEPLRHRRLGHQERAGDLGRGQAAERPQRQRDLRLRGERRVAAREDELEPLVGEGRLVHVVLRRLGHVEQPRLLRQRPLTAEVVERAVARRRDQPRALVGGDPVARPAGGGDREGLLGGLLGELEVAEDADQGGQHAPPLVAEGLLERSYHSAMGRTSMAPPMLAAGIFAASSIAASRSAASKIR